MALQPLIPQASKALLMNELGSPIARANELGDTLPPLDSPPMESLPLDANVARTQFLQNDLAKRSNPTPPTTPLGKIGHVAANIGNVLGDIFAPDAMSLIPHTQLYNERIMERDKADLNRVSQLQTAEAGRKQQAATTAYTAARPEIEQAKVLQKLTSSLAPKGIKATMNSDGTIDTEDDVDSQAYRQREALTALQNAQAEREQIMAQVGQPGSPLYEQKQRALDQVDRRIGVALAGLGLRREALNIQGERLNLDEDKTYNPEPTAQERSKGDLAQSAVDRVAEMKSVVAKRPDIFGPVAGRATNAQAWLGSSDPDAVTYRNASQYLADHSAGVFGGRGAYITSALHDLTSPRFTPEGLNAALDEADRAAKGFVQAGTVHAKGQKGTAAKQAEAPQAEEYVRDPKTNKLVKKAR